MPIIDPMLVLLGCAAARDAEISPRNASYIGLDTIKRWVGLGVVRETDPLPTVRCERCRERDSAWVNEKYEYGGAEDPETDWCWADLSLDRIDKVIAGATARCPRDGTTYDVVVNDIRRWVLDLPALARTVASLLGCSGKEKQFVPDRLFDLGRATGDPVGEVLLLRGLDWDDGEHVLETATRAAAGHSQVFGVVIGEVDVRLDVPASLRLMALHDLVQWTGEGFARRKGNTSSLSPSTTPGVEVAGEPTNVKPIPTPEGTAWEDIYLRVGETRLCARIQGQRHWRHYTDVGLADGRRGGGSGEVTERWKVLMEFASSAPRMPSTEGAAGREGDRPARAVPSMSREQMTRLRPVLRALFPSVPNAKHDPILSVRKGRARDAWNGRSYRLLFQIAPLPDPCFETPDGVTWPHLFLQLQRDVVGDVVRVTVRGLGARGPRGVASDHAAERHLAGESFRLRELVSSEASEELLADLLRRRVLNAPRDSVPVFDLRRDLARFFDLSPDGIEFDAKRSGWFPVFQIE